MPKLNCQEAQNLLEAFHDNELDGVSSLAVQEHLDECPYCRRQWRWLCEVEASLQRLCESTLRQLKICVIESSNPHRPNLVLSHASFERMCV
jgi:predicted anti-sigma-YlaC factor YlaD